MKNVTIILGPSGSGKTTLAKKIAEGRKTIFANSINPTNWDVDNLTAETEIIVIEECWPLDKVLFLICCDSLVINKRGFDPCEVECPDLVFTSNLFIPKDFKCIKNLSYVQFIELKQR
jgi:hypothetical protein